ncbi:hypothetical protein B9Z55_027223 [Caenorhabditis nigoni]|nr:hypothetical protein B9Z55_027223 [Caenorhabditis nigoni]
MICHIFINHIKHWKSNIGKENEVVVVREKQARNGEKTSPDGISCFWQGCDSWFTNRKDMEQHAISSHFELDDVEWVIEEEEEKTSEIQNHSETSGSQELLDSGLDTLNYERSEPANAPESAEPESPLSRILKSEQLLVRRLQDTEFDDADSTVVNPGPQKRMRLDYDRSGPSNAPEFEDEMPDELLPPTSSEVSSSRTTKSQKYRTPTTLKRSSAPEYKDSDGKDETPRRITRSRRAWQGVPVGSRRVTRSQQPCKEKKAKRNSVSGQKEKCISSVLSATYDLIAKCSTIKKDVFNDEKFCFHCQRTDCENKHKGTMKNQIICEAREKLRSNGSEFNRGNLIDALSTLKKEYTILKHNGVNYWQPKKGMNEDENEVVETLEEEPAEADHVEAEIMDGSANFRRPENQIAEDFEYPNQERNVVIPANETNGNSSHEEARDSLEPKFPIFEAAVEAKNESESLIRLLDDYGSSDSEDDQSHFFRKSPTPLAPDGNEPESKAPEVIVSGISEASKSAMSEFDDDTESPLPASTETAEDVASSEYSTVTSLAGEAPEAQNQEASTANLEVMDSSEFTNENGDLANGNDTEILSQSAANSPDHVSPEISVAPEMEVEAVEDQKASEYGNKVVDQDDKGYQEDDSAEQVLEESESSTEEFNEADSKNGAISEAQDQKDQDVVDFEGTEIPGTLDSWRPKTISRDSKIPGNSESKFSEALNQEAKPEFNGPDVQNQEETEFVDVEGAREVPHQKSPDMELASERRSEDDEEIDDEVDEEFLKEEVNRTIQDQKAVAEILEEDVNLQKELLEWNQRNEVDKEILESSTPASSLEDVASSESSSNSPEGVNREIPNPAKSPSPMRPDSEDGVSNVLEEKEGEDEPDHQNDAGNFEDLEVSAAGNAVETDEQNLQEKPMETEEAPEVQSQEEEEFLDVEGISDEEDLEPSDEFEAMRLENLAAASTIPEGPLEDYPPEIHSPTPSKSSPSHPGASMEDPEAATPQEEEEEEGVPVRKFNRKFGRICASVISLVENYDSSWRLEISPKDSTPPPKFCIFCLDYVLEKHNSCRHTVQQTDIQNRWWRKNSRRFGGKISKSELIKSLEELKMEYEKVEKPRKRGRPPGKGGKRRRLINFADFVDGDGVSIGFWIPGLTPSRALEEDSEEATSSRLAVEAGVEDSRISLSTSLL